MRHYFLVTNCVVFLCIAVTFGGNRIRDRICDSVLPNNRVKRQGFLDSIATQEEFLVIYSLAVNSDSEFDDYFKARRSFRENRYGATYRQSFMGTEFCSNNGVRFEEDDNPVENIVEIRQRGRCVREDSYTVEGDLTGIQTRFYSQDLSRYFWWFICRGEGTVESFPDSCTGKSFLELHIKDLRDPPTPNTELNLTSFPWELALQDLKDIAGVTFADPSVEYRWLGDECTL